MVWIFPRKSRTHRTLGSHQIQVSTTVWSNWSDKKLEGSIRKLQHTPFMSEHCRRPFSPSPTVDRAASPSTTSCGPFLPPQVSKIDLLCRLDCIGSITPQVSKIDLGHPCHRPWCHPVAPLFHRLEEGGEVWAVGS
jgi:hypothetical protein